ncbi:CDP-alcohol phosphatidyltransferase family protein [Rhizohabitans arisaemae]|uniref:CDP-alcohol phosphatidyltransferase family protein n=1 Tax=Rhizohabitans arisaemae TaxID=2720610 RepID=UPI0024B209CE|nr:CDP-alcohol phosphatidyltransferase family protein [Rhizohabitans arisaemae]
MPPWVTPDRCTAVGVGGAALTAAGFFLSGASAAFLWLAVLGVLLNWLGDSLDGNIARLRKIERPRYGFFIDHACDAVCQVLIFLGLGLSPYVDFTIASLALIGYSTLAILMYIRTCVSGEFKISYGRMGPTEARAVLILLTVAMLVFGPEPFVLEGVSFTGYDVVVGGVGVTTFIFFAGTAWTERGRLAALGE